MSGKSRSSQRRLGRGVGQEDNATPDVYKDMLAEVASSEPGRFEDDGRTIKRRKLGRARDANGDNVQIEGGQNVPERSTDPVQAPIDGFDDLFEERPAPQVAYDDFEDSEESDVDWEEVDLTHDNRENILGSEDEDKGENDGGDLDLVLLDVKGKGKRASLPKRRPITAAERKLRVEVHKMHLLCLLYHVFLRNNWCNDLEAQAALKQLLTPRTVGLLNPDPRKTQFQRTTLFTAGLTEASSLWASKFKITARGMKKATWTDDEEKLKNYRLPEDVDLPMEKSDFRDHARKLEGSRDIGAQLFCALLRSVGVVTRLVCSLQPLPFNFATAIKGTTPQKSRPKATYPADDDRENTSDEADSVNVHNMDGSVGSGSSSGPLQEVLPQVPQKARRLWQPKFGSGNHNLGKPPPPKVPRVRRIKESAYPVYWIEAFNIAHQKWIPVDPLTTHSVGKPFKLEPPASESTISMSYVVAFEDGGDARDVTKRYAKAINAKTRKARVEITKGGERWWKKAMRFFEREFDLDRDQVEDAEFAAREAGEEMPRNVQDFKGHPYYALERHLRRNEVIHPKREIGKLTTRPVSKGKGPEPIYRRSDVHVVKSADGWYRAGREIKHGEQPLKRTLPKRGRVHLSDDDEPDGPGEGPCIGLYAAFQTISYEPPPVVHGRVPKNSYGNIDVYIPSMVPKGGVHLEQPDAARSARLLCIDYADAVIGFDFKGHRGTAITRGIVAAVEYREALEAAIRGFADAREEEEITKRSMRALAFWKRFLVALRIRERVAAYEIPGEVEGEGKELEAVNEAEDTDDEGGGGFFPEEGVEWLAEPAFRKVLRPKRRRGSSGDGPSYEGDTRGEFIYPENTGSAAAAHGDGFADPMPLLPVNKTSDWYEGVGDGGFIPEEKEAYADTGGDGFLLGSGDEGGRLTFGGNDATAATEGGGFLPNDSSNEVAEDGNFPTGDDAAMADSHTQDPPPTEGSRANPQTHLNPSPPAESRPRTATAIVGNTSVASPPTDDDDSDDFDRGSLLSHDPDDDDAEPDWLVSD
ncbi:MAG: hypothetical protein M1840_007405 [Geoglossum simile]|nr:MAG: hypothetical protein M1840_007405 [Geoglossum simile]